LRTAQGTYIEAFFIAGTTGLLAAGLALLIGNSPGGRRLERAPQT
jgi:hypothetical protein